MPAQDRQIRKLGSAELEDYRLHLLRLDVKSRHARFGWAMDDSGINARCLKLAVEPVFVVGAYVDNVLRGAAELWPDCATRRAELAFCVEENFRRQGLATALIKYAIQEMQTQDIQFLDIEVDDSDYIARSLIAKFRGRAPDNGSTADLQIPIQAVPEQTMKKIA
jgi:GNAT superfamily N-acetyltransferase